MAACASQAQSLGAVITTSAKLVTSTYRLYLMLDGKKALGLLKVGRKKLFIRVRARVFAASAVRLGWQASGPPACGYVSP